MDSWLQLQNNLIRVAIWLIYNIVKRQWVWCLCLQNSLTIHTNFMGKNVSRNQEDATSSFASEIHYWA